DPEPFRWLLRPFLVNQLKQRPYIHLKWAQTAHGYMGQKGHTLQISGPEAQRWTHARRARHQAILVGWQTLLTDNPRLNVRHHPGPDPEVILLSPQGALPPRLALRETAPLVYVINPTHGGGPEGGLLFVKMSFTDGAVPIDALWHTLLQRGVSSIFVEGGAQLHRSILSSGLFDELSVVHSPHTLPDADIPAPPLPAGLPPAQVSTLGADQLWHWELPL
ncbi:MAG: RibD family protein, partial [Bacteroidetes bacterium]|nr:RibD family protein [Bacteroidota bacterium]